MLCLPTQAGLSGKVCSQEHHVAYKTIKLVVRFITLLKDEFYIDGNPLFTIVFLTYRCLAYGGRISDVVEMLENEGLVFSS